MGNLGQNLRYAVRQLSRSRGFTATVIVTLALSIGANTAIFSIVNALMLRSLPYPHPERMGTVFFRFTGPQASDSPHNLDGALWEQLRDSVPSLISAVSGGTSGVNLQAGQHVQYVRDSRVSAHYLDALGIHPTLGRNFSDEEDRPKGPPAVILTEQLWRMAFNADPGLIGQTIRLKGEPFTVIGVLPRGTVTPGNADLLTALQPSRQGAGGGSNFEMIARLRDGATWQQAQAELNRAWAFRTADWYMHDVPGASLSFHLAPLQQGETAQLRPRALALMSAAGFILLIACANLAGLTLVRMARRVPEIATRLALGGTRWQVQKQLWIETLLLAAGGGAAGLGVGYAALRGLLSLLPQGSLPAADFRIDLQVLGFTSATALLTSILFGMLPALAVRKVDLRSSMASRAVTGGERLRLRQALIAGEVALTVVLLAGSGLLIRTLIHLETLPPGFDPYGVMTAKASLDDARYHDPASFNKLLNNSIAAMRRIPGVENAAVGLTLPFERTLNDALRVHDGPQAGQMVQADYVYASNGYFETLRIPLLAGRTFSASDGPHAQPVAIVNRSFARKFFPGVNPIGRVLDRNVVIVGVVADIQLSSGLNSVAPLQTEETVYAPYAQIEPQLLSLVHVWFQPSWIVRTAGPIEGLTEQMQRALADADPGLPFSGFYRMSDLQAETLSTQRIEVALLGAMAGLALLLSAVGIFALIANLVAQRTREIGIRMALGSSMRQAMATVARSGVQASLAGLVVGLVFSAGALRVMRSVLYGVNVYDATTLAAVVGTLLIVALGATALPALRIARIDPATTLREE